MGRRPHRQRLDDRLVERRLGARTHPGIRAVRQRGAFLARGGDVEVAVRQAAELDARVRAHRVRAALLAVAVDVRAVRDSGGVRARRDCGVVADGVPRSGGADGVRPLAVDGLRAELDLRVLRSHGGVVAGGADPGHVLERRSVEPARKGRQGALLYRGDLVQNIIVNISRKNNKPCGHRASETASTNFIHTTN